jgi:glycine/D-amino acid oxidase-like deaminating enzyme
VNSDKVVIIGGGVIGCSIAYYLTKEDVDVILFEKYELASGASGANQGGVLSQNYDPPLLDLVLESQKLYAELKELPFDLEFDKCGSVICITEGKQWPILEERARRLRKSGLIVNLVDGTDLRELEPNLSRDILGASLYSEDFEVNPFNLTYAFAHAAKTLGAKIHTCTEVKNIVVKNGKVESVITNKGKLKTDYVVNSAGVWSPLIGGSGNLRLPVKPQRGQLLVTEPMLPCNFRFIVDADYLTTAFDPSSVRKSKDPRIRRGIACTLSQTKNGNWLIGSSRDLAGFDRRTALADLKIIVRRSLRFLPYLRYVNVLRTFAGLRPYSTDGLPILGKVEAVEGLILATGHCGDGVALAPITGKIIAEIITKDKPEMEIDKFSYSRFKSAHKT